MANLDWMGEEGASFATPCVTKIIAGKYVKVPLTESTDDFLDLPVDIPVGSASGIGRHLASNVAEIDLNEDSDLFYGDDVKQEEIARDTQVKDRGFDLNFRERPNIYGSSDLRDIPDRTEDDVNVFDTVEFDEQNERSDLPGIIHESEIEDSVTFGSDTSEYTEFSRLYGLDTVYAKTFFQDMEKAGLFIDYDADKDAFTVTEVKS